MTSVVLPDEYVPAGGFGFLTPWYDALLAITIRERRMRDTLRRLIGPRAGDRVLDIGSGTGSFALLLKRRHPDALVTGIDGDPEILGMAQAKARDAGLDVSFRQGLAQDLPFPDGSFDVVTSSLVFHHLTRAAKRAAFRGILRVLVPGGRLVLADWGRPIGPIEELLFLIVRFLDGDETTKDNAAGRLPALMREAGFASVREARRERTFYGILSYFVAVKEASGWE